MLRTLLVVLRINAIGCLIVYENILRQSIKFPLYRNLSHTTCMIDVYYIVHVAILTRL